MCASIEIGFEIEPLSVSFSASRGAVRPVGRVKTSRSQPPHGHPPRGAGSSPRPAESALVTDLPFLPTWAGGTFVCVIVDAFCA